MDKVEYYYRVGIDPAWKNLGVTVIKEHPETHELTMVKSWVMNPSTYKSIPEFILRLWTEIHNVVLDEDETAHVTSVTIERFVPYNGQATTESEDICMIIGALHYVFSSKEVALIRAIDWKMNLVKALHKKKGFENPSSKLDKKFSIAAAKACLDHEHNFATDHEADALCLAAYPVIMRK